MLDHLAVGNLPEVRRRPVEGCSQGVQEHGRDLVRVLAAAAVGMREITARELLDDDLVGSHLREQRRNAPAQYTLNVGINARHHALRAEVVAGVVLALPLPMHHLHALGIVEALIARGTGLRKVLQQAEKQGPAVAITRRGHDRCVIDVLVVKERLDGLRTVLVIEQHHALGRPLDVLLHVRAELGDGVEHRLARLHREDAFGHVCQRRHFRQRRGAGALDQEQGEAGSLGLANQGHEVLHTRQDFRAIVRLAGSRLLRGLLRRGGRLVVFLSDDLFVRWHRQFPFLNEVRDCASG